MSDRSFAQVTLDDLWSLDVVKLSGWQLVQDNSAGREDFAEGERLLSESDGSGDDGYCHHHALV